MAFFKDPVHLQLSLKRLDLSNELSNYLFILFFRIELDVARRENEELRVRLSKYENIANLNLKSTQS